MCATSKSLLLTSALNPPMGAGKNGLLDMIFSEVLPFTDSQHFSNSSSWAATLLHSERLMTSDNFGYRSLFP